MAVSKKFARTHSRRQQNRHQRPHENKVNTKHCLDNRTYRPLSHTALKCTYCTTFFWGYKLATVRIRFGHWISSHCCNIILSFLLIHSLPSFSLSPRVLTQNMIYQQGSVDIVWHVVFADLYHVSLRRLSEFKSSDQNSEISWLPPFLTASCSGDGFPCRYKQPLHSLSLLISLAHFHFVIHSQTLCFHFSFIYSFSHLPLLQTSTFWHKSNSHH